MIEDIAIGSDEHDIPFCTKAVTIVDNFKKALGDSLPIILNFHFLKAISVIDKLSPINFFVAVNFQCV